MSVAAVLPALSLEACPRIAPVPQSKLTTERHGGEDQQMVVVYRQDNDGCGDTWCQVWATDGRRLCASARPSRRASRKASFPLPYGPGQRPLPFLAQTCPSEIAIRD